MFRLKASPNLSSIHDVHNWLNNCSDAYDSTSKFVILDLSRLEWISPLGATVMLSTLDKISSKKSLAVIIPRQPQVISYLVRMKFFDICPMEVRRQFEEADEIDMEFYYKRYTQDLSRELIELSKTNKLEDITALSKQLYLIMKNKGLSSTKCSDIMSYISELGANAIEHGETSCYSAVQYYSASNEINISVSDMGGGIFNTLNGGLSIKDKDEVIKAAIYTEATRHKGENRGKGLLDVKRRIFQSETGEIYLRTHDASYSVKENKLIKIEEGHWFYGTFFKIRV